MRQIRTAVALSIIAAANPGLAAEIKVGVIASATGPDAAMGVPYRNTLALLPERIGGNDVKCVFTDDASDPTQGVRNARLLISEDNYTS